jgi:hypothetical protein
MNEGHVDISLKWQEDISAITSPPCFEKERSPSYGGSLFSRLLKAQLAVKEFQVSNITIGSPIESSDEEPSPIKASDSLIEYEPELSSDNQSFSFVEQTKANVKEEVPVSSQSMTSSSRRHRILSLLQSIDSIDVDEKERKSNLHHGADQNCKPIVNVSFDTSRNSRSEQTSVLLNSSRTSHQIDNSSKKDEWKEVIDPESRRTYYYNRKTRVSKWKLPKGAVLAKPKSSSRSVSVSFRSNETGLQHFEKLESARNASHSFENNATLETKSCHKIDREDTHVGFNDSHGELSFDTRQLKAHPTLREDTVHNEGSHMREDASFQSPSRQSSYQERAANHFQSPQDCGLKMSDNFFCMFSAAH